MSKTMAPAKSLNKQALFRDLGYEPHPGQAEIHASTASRRVVASGVRWGKSRCAAMEALASAMEARDRSIGWVEAHPFLAVHYAQGHGREGDGPTSAPHLGSLGSSSVPRQRLGGLLHEDTRQGLSAR